MSDDTTKDPDVTLKQWHTERDNVLTFHEPGETGDYRAVLAAIEDMPEQEYDSLHLAGAVGDNPAYVKPAEPETPPPPAPVSAQASRRIGVPMPPVNPVSDVSSESEVKE